MHETREKRTLRNKGPLRAFEDTLDVKAHDAANKRTLRILLMSKRTAFSFIFKSRDGDRSERRSPSYSVSDSVILEEIIGYGLSGQNFP